MRSVLVACGIAAFLATLGSLGFALGSGAEVNISQKGRAFMPASIEIDKGDTLAIRNDDEYIHQVFVASPSFSFDSGEQEIGQTVRITFPTSGTFQVLCAIHPKMRLDVVVK
ncbi:MAG TPA: plastocyanin/azurin family copper-binding protein [Stellaceae bacterium]|nr:plastocyanin/azurin family copper-binding protein [Stellaceae bacterium]